jgi:hypothetical protein
LSLNNGEFGLKFASDILFGWEVEEGEKERKKGMGKKNSFLSPLKVYILLLPKLECKRDK